MARAAFLSQHQITDLLFTLFSLSSPTIFLCKYFALLDVVKMHLDVNRKAAMIPDNNGSL
jgi:hypothetical protein